MEGALAQPAAVAGVRVGSQLQRRLDYQMEEWWPYVPQRIASLAL